MKGELRLKGSVRISVFDLEADIRCQSFEEVEKTLSWVESLKFMYPPTKRARG